MNPIKIDQLLRSRRRSLSVTINQDATVTVRAPHKMSLETIDNFLERKKGWIMRKVRQVQRYPVPLPKAFVSGEKFPYLGHDYPLEIVDAATHFQLSDAFRLASHHQTQARDVFLNWYRNQAHEVLTQRAETYANQMNLRYRTIKINSARTRWGSCASNGNLNFTWRLIMAPLFVVDYVVVHELSHIPIKNHSRLFWQKVQTVMPNYKAAVAWLRLHGQQLIL